MSWRWDEKSTNRYTDCDIQATVRPASTSSSTYIETPPVSDQPARSPRHRQRDTLAATSIRAVSSSANREAADDRRTVSDIPDLNISNRVNY